MSLIMLIGSLLLSGLSFAGPGIGAAPVKHLYVPQGFDSNDAVEVVVTGHFPNPCYSRNGVAVVVKKDLIEIEITSLYPSEKKLCPDMIVPFKEVVSIGNLQGGQYKLLVNNKLKDILTVVESDSNAVDDNIYGAIDGLEKVSNTEYILRGWRYSSCLELDRIDVISNGKDTFSVLPVMKQISDFCPMKGVPVSYPVTLKLDQLVVKEPLIHVRTIDGKSFNTILMLEE